MNPIDLNRDPPQPNLDFEEKVFKNLITELMTKALPSATTLREGDLTQKQYSNLLKNLNQLGQSAEELFENSDPSVEEVTKFASESFTSIISEVIKTVESQPRNFTVEVDLSQAAFTHSQDCRPILATAFLATCIGVAGYDRTNKFGFLVHFTDEKEIEASGKDLLARIKEYKENSPNSPLLIHLRGGIENMSEPLLEAVKEWLIDDSLNAIIVSEDTLHPSIAPGIGLPLKPASMQLDTRTGRCDDYKIEENMFSKKIKEEKSESLDFKDVLNDSMIDAKMQKPKIEIVYDSKK